MVFAAAAIAAAPQVIRQILPATALEGVAQVMQLPVAATPLWASSGMLLMFGSIAAMGGIGGGAMVVTVFMVFDGLTPHDAIPLSKSVVFAGTIFSNVLNILVNRGQAKGLGDKKIDADVAVVMVPGALSGTFLGVALNRVLAGEVLLGVLLATLVVTTGMVILRCYRDVTAERAERELRNAPPGDENEPLQPQPNGAETEQRSATKGLEEHYASLWKIVGLLGLTVAAGVVMRLSLDCYVLKLADKFEPCESGFLRAMFGNLHDHPEHGFFTQSYSVVLALSPGLLTLVMTFVVLTSIFRSGDLGDHWTRAELEQLSVIGVLAGLLAGLVGVGGGLIFAPALLHYGMVPAAVVGTSTFCVLFTASSTTFQYLFLNRIILTLVPVYSIVNIFACLVGSVAVQVATSYNVPKSFLSFVVLLAVLTSAIFSCIKLEGLVNDHPLSELPASFLTHGDGHVDVYALRSHMSNFRDFAWAEVAHVARHFP